MTDEDEAGMTNRLLHSHEVPREYPSLLLRTRRVLVGREPSVDELLSNFFVTLYRKATAIESVELGVSAATWYDELNLKVAEDSLQSLEAPEVNFQSRIDF